MTYEEVVKKAKQATKKMDAGKIAGHIAIQFDVEGEGEGAFYVEVSNAKVAVEPYEYYDHNCKVRGGADAILALLAGKLNAAEARSEGQIRLEGDEGKFSAFVSAVNAAPKKPAAPKTATTKKAPAKKPVAEKAPVKKEVTEKAPAKKEVAKKAPAKKADSKK